MTQENKQAKKKRTSGMREVKALIAGLSLVSVVGLWNVFAQEVTPADAAAQAAQVPPAVQAESKALNLPPIPTLVPQLADTVSENNNANLQPAPQFQAPQQLFLGGAQPQARQFAPMTRTRSSR